MTTLEGDQHEIDELLVPIESLTPHPSNARRSNVDAIAESLNTHGQYRPIVVRKQTNEILAGNHTWQAAQQLGWKEIGATFVDCDDDQALRILLVDNRLNDLGGYDDEALVAILQEVNATEEGLLGTGFDEQALQELLDGIEPSDQEALTDVDDVPDAPPAISKPGDVWELGSHKVICGDSTQAATYAALLGDELAGCVITDPPYNVAYEGGTKDKLTIENDNMEDHVFKKFLVDAFSRMNESMDEGAPIYVFYADGSAIQFRKAFNEAGFQARQTLIWVKNTFSLSRQDYNWQHEPIIYGWKDGAAHTWLGQFNKSTVFDYDTFGEASDYTKAELVEILNGIIQNSTVIRENKPARNAEHPTMKPVNLIKRLIVNSAHNSDIVLDPFGGSGSTLIACHHTNRKARLIEFDPRYVDVICRRWQEHTGQFPINAATRERVDFTKED